jgi:hypothetical protein
VRPLGIGTAADHHVHHKLFKYNFGHIFMWFVSHKLRSERPRGKCAFTFREPDLTLQVGLAAWDISAPGHGAAVQHRCLTAKENLRNAINRFS